MATNDRVVLRVEEQWSTFVDHVEKFRAEADAHFKKQFSEYHGCHFDIALSTDLFNYVQANDLSIKDATITHNAHLLPGCIDSSFRIAGGNTI